MHTDGLGGIFSINSAVHKELNQITKNVFAVSMSSELRKKLIHVSISMFQGTERHQTLATTEGTDRQ